MSLTPAPLPPPKQLPKRLSGIERMSLEEKRKSVGGAAGIPNADRGGVTTGRGSIVGPPSFAPPPDAERGSIDGGKSRGHSRGTSRDRQSRGTSRERHSGGGGHLREPSGERKSRGRSKERNSHSRDRSEDRTSRISIERPPEGRFVPAPPPPRPSITSAANENDLLPPTLPRLETIFSVDYNTIETPKNIDAPPPPKPSTAERVSITSAPSMPPPPTAERASVVKLNIKKMERPKAEENDSENSSKTLKNCPPRSVRIARASVGNVSAPSLPPPPTAERASVVKLNIHKIEKGDDLQLAKRGEDEGTRL